MARGLAGRGPPLGRLRALSARWRGRGVNGSLCGHWHAGLGSSDTFACPKCDLVIGRDLNGAIGNFYAAYGEAVGVGWDRCSG